MFEIEEKSKRKAKPPRQYLASALLVIVGFIAGILFTLVVQMAQHQTAQREIEIIATHLGATSAYVAIQIEQTNAAATQFFLATTSPNALTPTPRP